jgi:HlyD family secretion protein
MEVNIVNRWLKRAAVLAAVVLVIVVLRMTVFRPKPVPVTVFDVERGRVEATVVNSRAGTIKSRHRSEMSPGVAGLVARIPIRKGQPARRGQVLLQLDDSEYRAQVTLAERSLDAARASADEACLSADQAERDRVRSEDLFTQNLISDQDLDAARTRAEVARAGCVAAQALIRQSAASLDAARATLAKTVIIAPFDGIVLDVTTEVGEWISPSPPGVFIPPVVDLIDPTTLYVEAPLDEADVAKVALDLPVRITMDAFRGQSFAGTLTYTSSFVETSQEQNRTLTVEAEFAAGHLPANVLPGLSADIEVILDAHDDVTRIPSYALMEGNRVLLVRDGKLRSVSVTTGLNNWEYTEIRSGLEPGDQIVVSLDRPDVVAGARVEVTKVLTK